MNRFAALLDRLAYEPRRNAKLTILTDYFRTTPDPERGYALAAMTGGLSFANAKAGLIRALIEERVDPVLFRLSYDYVGDLSETVALLWPEGRDGPDTAAAGNLQTLAHVVETLGAVPKRELPRLIAGWLDALDASGRWALLKLITGALRIGVSARLAKTAVAEIGGVPPDDVERVWHGLKPPYLPLFAWVEGHADRPETDDPAPFHPPMLAHPFDEVDPATLRASDFAAEWKWDGIRVQAVAGPDAAGRMVARLYSRTGEDISAAFPDVLEHLTLPAALDGELLIMRAGRVQSFNTLQQRLNRKQVTAKLIAEFPAHIRAYDLLTEGGEDLRERPFAARRERLQTFIARLNSQAVDLSTLVPFESWEALAEARADPAKGGAGADAEAVEGCMIKRIDSAYVPGRPKGLWFKWKRAPYAIDAVLMYAQRGHGKRSSFYSDYTFGVWRSVPAEDGGRRDELVPVGKAYFGFTDEELVQIDRYVRRNTVNRFGPVREVTATADAGFVFEIAFEGIQRSPRHKSGVAMRFPRIARLRPDKRPADADRLDSLEAMIMRAERDTRTET
jgi:DNA ligase-1